MAAGKQGPTAGGGATSNKAHHVSQICSHVAVYDIECCCGGVATGKTHPQTCHGTSSPHVEYGYGPNHKRATHRQL